jgi:ubiquinone/menaquinone biosynthesis C-methylase UbiE
MFKFFKRTTLDPLSVTMVGVKLADRVLVIGCHDPKLIAALAIKSGLTGRTCGVDPSEAAVGEAERVALAEGALVEFASAPLTALPYDASSFDVVVLRDVMRGIAAAERLSVAAESARVLRGGGRCMIIDSTAAGAGLASMFGRTAPADSAAADDMIETLKAAGYVAVRSLAEREGLLFLEAVKRA